MISPKYPIATLNLLLLWTLGPAALPAGAGEFAPERNDLSICSGKNATPKADDPVDVKLLASRLHGTWALRTRTIQGVTIDTDSKYWIDLDEVNDRGAKGWAMMIDRGNLHTLDHLKRCPACLADASVGALWQVTISLDPGGRSIHLKLDGDYLGSYGEFQNGMKATEQAHFHQYGSVFLAGQLASPAGFEGIPDDIWDRISVADGVMVYTSCKDGFIDRFVKLSDEKPNVRLTGDKPNVSGMRLPEAWQAIKASGTISNPPHVDTWK